MVIQVYYNEFIDTKVYCYSGVLILRLILIQVYWHSSHRCWYSSVLIFRCTYTQVTHVIDIQVHWYSGLLTLRFFILRLLILRILIFRCIDTEVIDAQVYWQSAYWHTGELILRCTDTQVIDNSSVLTPRLGWYLGVLLFSCIGTYSEVYWWSGILVQRLLTLRCIDSLLFVNQVRWHSCYGYSGVLTLRFLIHRLLIFKCNHTEV